MRKFGFQPSPQSHPKNSDHSVPNSSHHMHPNTKEVQYQTEKQWEPDVLFTTKLERSVTCTISNPNIDNTEDHSDVGLGIARVVMTKKQEASLFVASS